MKNENFEDDDDEASYYDMDLCKEFLKKLGDLSPDPEKKKTIQSGIKSMVHTIKEMHSHELDPQNSTNIVLHITAWLMYSAESMDDVLKRLDHISAITRQLVGMSRCAAMGVSGEELQKIKKLCNGDGPLKGLMRDLMEQISMQAELNIDQVKEKLKIAEKDDECIGAVCFTADDLLKNPDAGKKLGEAIIKSLHEHMNKASGLPNCENNRLN